MAGTLNQYMNLKMLVRGRPRFLDPQLDRGTIRFASKRGASFSALLPDNKYQLSESAFKDSTRVSLESRPGWYQIDCLIRVGLSEDVGELHIINDIIDTTSVSTREPLVANYIVTDETDPLPFVTLIGTPMTFFGLSVSPQERKVLLMESWYQMVPGDSILLSPSPQVLDSLAEFEVTKANLITTRPGVGGIEPVVIYRYEIEISSDSNLIPFTPSVGLLAYLKAQPMFQRGDYGAGDLQIPPEVGPCLLDGFFGDLQINNRVRTKLGIKTWDAFGGQINTAAAGDQQWQAIPTNYLMLERPIRSDTFLFWQRISGKFQLLQHGFFQAELDANGEFVMSSDLLVPRWPTDKQRGWVIPVIPATPVTISVQFEPQERQYYTLPANTLSFIRPHIVADPAGTPITRVVVAIKGAPGSRVEIRDWQYDGSAVLSLSYFMLGTGAAFGNDRWLAGGFCVKPLFFNLDVLKARYSDGVSRYNAGYIYT